VFNYLLLPDDEEDDDEEGVDLVVPELPELLGV